MIIGADTSKWIWTALTKDDKIIAQDKLLNKLVKKVKDYKDPIFTKRPFRKD